LSFSSVDKGLKSLLVTSTNASEGKSFVSSNLATAYAQAGMNVVLIDGDLRKGRLHRVFKLRNVRGFSDLLIDKKSRSYDKYLKETAVEGLTVITRGTCPPNPSELLGSTRAKGVIKKLLEQFDMVIIDGAPSMGLSDSIVASKLVDGVALVCRDGKTNRADLAAVVEDYKKINAPFLGVIMNDIKHGDTGYYNYYEKDRSVADQQTMEGLNDLNDAIEASREALTVAANNNRKKQNRKSSYTKKSLSDLPNRAELKKMAKKQYVQEKNS
jgi:capsular exopolysaccharide synthesis family protein